MGKLHDELVRILELKNSSPRTIEAYTSYVKRFVLYHGRPAQTLGEAEVKEFLYYLLKKKEVGASTINGYQAALRFFFKHVLGKPLTFKKVPWAKRPKKLPVVFSPQEVGSLLAHFDKYKYSVIAKTLYATGMRLGEALRLKVAHIDSRRGVIQVINGKGQKDRTTLLSPALLIELRSYWRHCHPSSLMFPGHDGVSPMGDCNFQRAFKLAQKKPA